MRDPLSISPVVLGESRIPGAMNQYFNQQIQLEQQRRQEDANKVAALTQLATVDAVGWEKDQQVIDKMKDEHQKMVTDAMIQADGKPDPATLRKIQKSADMIKTVAATSVAHKKNFQSDINYIRNNFDKMDYQAATEALTKHYANTDILNRSVFDVSPYLKPEQEDVDIFKPFASMTPSVSTRVSDVDGERSMKQTADWGVFENAVKTRVASGGVYQKAYENAVKAGKVSDVDGFARMIRDDKQAQIDLRSEYRKSEDADNLVWNDNLSLSDGTLASGYLIKKATNIPVQFKDGLMDFSPMAIVTKDGDRFVEGTVKIKVPSRTITEEEYKRVPVAEQKDYTWDIASGGYKKNSTVRYEKRLVPYEEVGDLMSAKVKGVEKIAPAPELKIPDFIKKK